MPELHDGALHEEHAATDRDHEAKQLAQRLEDERRQLQDFADWMEIYSGESAEARVFGDEAYLPIPQGGTLMVYDSKIIPVNDSSINRAPYRALWAIYEKETSKQ